ncbi:MAG: CPBP family intramembrane glutamic endopeptidase [Myxococcota bacterium]
MDLRYELHPRHFVRRFFLDVWAELDADAAAERAREGRTRDLRPLWVFASAAVFLTLMDAWGMPGDFWVFRDQLADWELEGKLPGTFWQDFDRWDTWAELATHAWWALWRFFGFAVFPLAVMAATGEKLRDQHLSVRGLRQHLPIYLLSYALVMALVVPLSGTETFQAIYPFHRECGRSWADLLIWEALYLLQFFGLELFFRGWMLRSTHAALGSNAIFAMMVPYVMIHFGKAVPETLGAIFAGIFLGTLAARTRSIWGGLLVHGLVAVSMDLLALARSGGLPERLWPLG